MAILESSGKNDSSWESFEIAEDSSNPDIERVATLLQKKVNEYKKESKIV